MPFCDYDASNSHSICIYFACGMNNRASSRGPPYIATPVCLCVAYTVHEFSRLTLNIRQVKGKGAAGKGGHHLPAVIDMQVESALWTLI